METVGAAPLAADQMPRRETSQLDFGFEFTARQLGHRSITRYTSEMLGDIRRPRKQLFDETQLRLPIASKYEGVNFRETTRDPVSMGLATPTDELTGLPLPILIIDPPEKSANTSFVDYHHHYHPARDLETAGDAELALRRSRGQHLPRWLHEHYHTYFAGPEFPESRQDVFSRVVLACAGVVPRKAIDFSGFNGPKLVEIWDDSRFQRIHTSIKHEGEKRSGSRNFYRSQIGVFFANYAIEQSFEDVVSDKVIDQFLSTKDPQRRKILGNLMLREAIDLSIAPVIPLHTSLKKEGIVRRRKTDLRDLIKDYFVRSRQADYYQAIDQKLRVA